jgi:hypothetical protein
MYFAGLLVKVDVVEQTDQKAMGRFLIVILVLMLLSVCSAMLLHVYSVVTNVRAARHCGSVLKTLPQHDPPPDSEKFYLIQIPVEESNLGDSFAPKPPHLLSHIDPMQKLKVVHQLTVENEERLDSFFDKLQADWVSPLLRMKHPHQVDEYGKICVKYSRKTNESILAKATRPSIREQHPRFSVEHVRDTYRFKAVVFSFRDALRFVHAMDRDRSLGPNGLGKDCVAKLDIMKLKEPKEWGWRFLAFDFVMPNHQIVENYIVFTKMEAAKRNTDPDASVCPDLSNHQIFEKWRATQTSQLQGKRQAEFEQDKAESNRRYDEAFQDVQAHTSETELGVFWGAFGESPTPTTSLTRTMSVGMGLHHGNDNFSSLCTVNPLTEKKRRGLEDNRPALSAADDVNRTEEQEGQEATI